MALARVRAFSVVAITVMLLGVAHADKIDDLIRDLTASSDRVRISAVLGLANQKSPRAIPALARRLLDRSEIKNIRGLAATAIGRTVQSGNPSASLKRQAISALNKAKNDPEPFVSAKAEAALSQLGAASTSSRPSNANSVYINVGTMSIKTGNSGDSKFRNVMDRTAKSTLSRVAPKYKQTWPGGRLPSQADLNRRKTAGFYVFGTLNTLSVSKSGSSATVSCKISMLLADFPNKSAFGFLNGGARVQGGASARDIELGKSDCVEAVIEDLIAKKIVPTIRSKVP